MIQIDGIWWPDGTRESECQHALTHVKSLEWSLARCKQRRTAVQAGGNIGLWPRRMAQSFHRVVTFEPDGVSRACLALNVPDNVEVRSTALGSEAGTCGIKHRGLGSHNVIDGDACAVVPLDALGLHDVDLLQFDVEGYEGHALKGAEATINRRHPLIQVELRDGPLARHGSSADGIRGWLSRLGYRQVSKQQGSDFVFEAQA